MHDHDWKTIDRPAEAEDIVFPEPNTTGEGDLPLQSGAAMLAVRMAMELKELRVGLGLAIKDVAQKSGLDVATLSRLENGRIFNPRLDTLTRYALALGYEIEPRFVAIDPAYHD